MKKIFLSFILVFALFIPCMFALTACGNSDPALCYVHIQDGPDTNGRFSLEVAQLGSIDGPSKITDGTQTNFSNSLEKGSSGSFAVYIRDIWEATTIKILLNGENIFNLDPDFEFDDNLQTNDLFKAGTINISNIQEDLYLEVEADLRKIDVNVKFTDENQTSGNMPVWANDIYFLDYNNNKVKLSEIWGYNDQEYYTFCINALYIYDAVPLFCESDEHYWEIVEVPTGEFDAEENEIYARKFNGDEECVMGFYGDASLPNLDPHTPLYKEGFKVDGIIKDNVTFELTARLNGYDCIKVRESQYLNKHLRDLFSWKDLAIQNPTW